MSAALASGARLEVFERLDSTSLEARRRVAAGRRDAVFLVALEQTSGYGRRGAAWLQRTGDFAGTLVFAETAPVETLGQISFVAGLAVAQAILDGAPGADVRLKWPNDVLLDGGKAAGLLIELLDAAPGRSLLALGVGVNIVSRPDHLDYPTARLLDLPGVRPPAPDAFARLLDARFDAWRRRWRMEGFAPVRLAWLALCAHMGARMTVRLPLETVSGAFRDLDADGALVIDRNGSPFRIAAGAVLPPAEPEGRT